MTSPIESLTSGADTAGIPTTIRHRQLSHLNSQVAQLHANLSDFNELVHTTCTQYKSIEMLGKLHGAMFMASHAVFESDNFNTEES